MIRVRVFQIVAKGTVEDRVLAIQAKKEALIAQVRVVCASCRHAPTLRSTQRLPHFFFSIGVLRTQECLTGQGENRCVLALLAPCFGLFLDGCSCVAHRRDNRLGFDLWPHLRSCIQRSTTSSLFAPHPSLFFSLAPADRVFAVTSVGESAGGKVSCMQSMKTKVVVETVADWKKLGAMYANKEMRFVMSEYKRDVIELLREGSTSRATPSQHCCRRGPSFG